jgi:hypothetical protein
MHAYNITFLNTAFPYNALRYLKKKINIVKMSLNYFIRNFSKQKKKQKNKVNNEYLKLRMIYSSNIFF